MPVELPALPVLGLGKVREFASIINVLGCEDSLMWQHDVAVNLKSVDGKMIFKVQDHTPKSVETVNQTMQQTANTSRNHNKPTKSDPYLNLNKISIQIMTTPILSGFSQDNKLKITTQQLCRANRKVLS